MKYRILIISLILSNLGFGQINTIKDSLDNPIAMTFVKDQVFIALHGSLPGEGGIATFDIDDPQNSYQIKIDSLTLPRAIIEKDSFLYIGLRDDIVMVDLRNNNFRMDTIYHEQFLSPRSFAFDNENLIFAQDKALSKIDLTDPDYKKEILFFFDKNPLDIKKYGNSILIAEGKSIHEYNLNSNTITEIITNLNYNSYSMLIIGNHIYLDQGDLTFGTDEIVVFNLNDLASGSTSYCNNLGAAIALNEYQGAIYFAESKAVFNGMPEGKIQMITKELLSTNNIDTHEEILVFPNPTKNFININAPNQSRFTLYNSLGKTIKYQLVDNQIDLSNQPSGIYYLKVKGILEKSFKIIKE